MEKIKNITYDDVVENGLSVDWLNAMVDAVNGANNFTVDPTSGLEMARTKSGTAIRFNGLGNKLGRTASTVTALSGSTVGSGTCTLYCVVGTTFTSTGVTVPVYNMTTNAVAISTNVQLKLIDGRYFIDVVQC